MYVRIQYFRDKFVIRKIITDLGPTNIHMIDKIFSLKLKVPYLTEEFSFPMFFLSKNDVIARRGVNRKSI